MSDTITIEASNLQFTVDNRHFGADGGPAIRVYGNAEGQNVQLLRFDMFDKAPHYHYAPDGFNGLHNLDRAVVPDVMAWSLVQIRDNLRAMVKTAGYPQIADQIDVGAIRSAVPKLREALEEVAS